MVVQWLRLHTPRSGGLSSIPGQGSRSYKLQWRSYMPQLKIPEKMQTSLMQGEKACSHVNSCLHWTRNLLQALFQLRDQVWVSCVAGRFFTVWATNNPSSQSCLMIIIRAGVVTAPLSKDVYVIEPRKVQLQGGKGENYVSCVLNAQLLEMMN